MLALLIFPGKIMQTKLERYSKCSGKLNKIRETVARNFEMMKNICCKNDEMWPIFYFIWGIYNSVTTILGHL